MRVCLLTCEIVRTNKSCGTMMYVRVLFSNSIILRVSEVGLEGVRQTIAAAKDGFRVLRGGCRRDVVVGCVASNGGVCF